LVAGERGGAEDVNDGRTRLAGVDAALHAVGQIEHVKGCRP